MKKLISCLFAAVFLAVLLPAHAGAADGGKIPDCNLTWSLDDNGTLKISGSGAMPDFAYDFDENTLIETVDTPWWGQKDNITAIVIEEGVTTIGENAFYYCANLTSVTIPKGVTTIGDHAFFYCGKLTSVNIPASVTEIGDYVFYQCSALTEVSIPSGVETIGEFAFAYCNSLTEVTIPASVITIGFGAFSDCGKLASVTILEGVETIGANAFQGTALTSVTIPESVTMIGGAAFYHCTNLKSVTFKGKTPPEIHRTCFTMWGGSTSTYVPNKNIDTVIIPQNATPEAKRKYRGELEGAGIPESIFDQEGGIFYDITPLYRLTIVDDIDKSRKPDWYEPNAVVDLNAGTKDGYAFYCWVSLDGITLGGIDPTSPQITVTMEQSMTLATQWEELPPPPPPAPLPPSGGSSGGSGSPPSPSYYPPRVNQTAGGTVEISPARPQRGDTVTITATPDAGKMVSFVGATDRNGNVIEVTENGGIWTFTQPISVVTVGVVFVDEVQPWHNPFGDVQPDDWCYDAVQYVTENGLMTGTGMSAFSPNATSTRAMLWAILARQDGEEISGRAWETQAQAWATASGISDGTNPAGTLTREQLVTMLYRAAGSPTVSGDLSAFADSADVSEYAQAPLAWAVENGIVGGVGGNRIDPLGSATRAQLAAMLERYTSR